MASRNLLIEHGWIDRDFIDAHTTASTSTRRSCGRSARTRGRRRDGLRCRRSRDLAAPIHEQQAGLVLVDDGRQPEPPGGPHRPGDHQPRADDRQYRPARHRGQFDHRPVQRDGLAALLEHDQPARRPRLRQRPRTGRRSPACWRSPRTAFPTEPAGPTTRSSRASATARSAASG